MANYEMAAKCSCDVEFAVVREYMTADEESAAVARFIETHQAKGHTVEVMPRE